MFNYACDDKVVSLQTLQSMGYRPDKSLFSQTCIYKSCSEIPLHIIKDTDSIAFSILYMIEIDY